MKIIEKQPKKQKIIVRDGNRQVEINNIGHLPKSLQQLMNVDSKEYYENYEPNESYDVNIQSGIEAIMRKGVTQNINSSFLDAIKTVFDVDMEKIVNSITLDKFISALNGNLMKIFENKHFNENDIIKKDVEESIIFNEIMKDVSDDYKKYILSSYYNFKEYLMDKNVEIDYLFLWDFICKTNINTGLFTKKGVNLIILRKPKNTIVNRIDLICPSNIYNNRIYDESKPSIILYSYVNPMKPSVYNYEVVCKVTKTKSKKYSYNYFFNHNEMSNKMLFELGLTVETCKSINNTIKIKDTLQDILIKIGITMKSKYLRKFIINYNMQIIGIQFVYNKHKVFIPCLPSSFDISISPNKYIFIYDYVLKTSDDFMEIYNDLNQRFEINNPIIGYTEHKNKINTYITESDNIIPVNLPLSNKNISNLKKYKYSNYNINNEKTILTDTKNKDLENNIMKLRLEMNMYNMFRTTLKMVLNKNINYKNELLQIINNDDEYIYESKLMKILIPKLREILDDHITFVTFDNIKLNYNEVYNCFELTKSRCKKMSGKCAGFTDEKRNCSLLLPNKNLITGKSNIKIYYMKLADEILRKPDIRKYLFSMTNYISFDDQDYIINDDEIIIIEELLRKKYIQKSLLVNTNKYIQKYNLYQNRDRETDTAIVQTDKPFIIEKSNFKGNIRKLLLINEVNYSTDKLLSMLKMYIDRHHEIIEKKVEINNEILLQVLTDEMQKISMRDLYIIFKNENKDYKNLSKEGIINTVRNEKYIMKLFDIYLIFKHFNIPCFLSNDDGKHFKYKPTNKLVGMSITKTQKDKYYEDYSNKKIFNYKEKITKILKNDKYEITYYVKKDKGNMSDYVEKETIKLKGSKFNVIVKYMYTCDTIYDHIFYLVIGGIENKISRFSQIYYKSKENDIGSLSIKRKIFNEGLQKPIDKYIFKTKNYKNIFA